MIPFIKTVIAQFGGRIAGTETEQNAQEYVRGEFAKYCHTTRTEAFKSALDAHFESLKLFTLFYILNLGIYWFSPLAAIIAGFIIMVLFLGHFVGFRPWLDFLYPKKTSWNTIGDIEPEDTPVSTLIIAGHVDSVYEFRWWYKLKQTGAALTVFACILVGFQWLFMLPGYLIPGLTFSIFISLAGGVPVLTVLYSMHNKSVKVDGALDNLTGVALALEMAKTFSHEKLQHTRIRVISFGSEEPGLKGSVAYTRTHLDTLKKENAVLINIDTIKDKNQLSIVTGELNAMIFYPKKLIAELEHSFQSRNIPCKKVPLTIGVTDGAAFRMYGLPALSLVGMESGKLDPCYHTRLDTADHLDAEALDNMKIVLEDFIRKWDKKHPDME